MTTSWCDKLASTPIVGVRTTPSFVPGLAALEALAPLLSKIAKPDGTGFSVEHSDSYSTKIIGEDGYTYEFDRARAAVSFAHRYSLLPTSGGLPRMEITSDIAPYTAILANCEKRLTDLLEALSTIDERRITRIGIVTATTASFDDAPPGVNRILDYLTGPWSSPRGFAFNFMQDIDETEAHTDRCIYTFVYQDQDNTLPQFNFDWQRIFDEEEGFQLGDWDRQLRYVHDNALAFFEYLGEKGLEK